MSIEAKGVARSAAVGESKSIRGKQGDSANGGGGGFMALLASVETTQSAVSSIPDAAATGNNVGVKFLGKTKGENTLKVVRPDVDAVAGDVGQLDGTSAADEVSATSVADDSLLVDDSVAAAAAASLLCPTEDPQAPADSLGGIGALLGQSAAWTASMTGGGEPGSQPAGSAITLAVGANGSRATPVLAGGVVSTEAEKESLAASMQKIAKVAVDSKTKSLQGATLATETTALPDGKALATNQKATIDSRITPSLVATVASAAAAATLIREDQPRERSVFRSNGNTDSSTAPQAILTAAPTLTVSSSPEVIAPTDAFVAEKVSYWISNNVQNAEMTLDGMGDRPVEVSIRMQGNEAHVAFRTDELQTRAALENASTHLKDMLQREGLILSGVSVDTAGSGDSRGQDRQSRQSPRQATVTTLQPVGNGLGGVSSRVSSGGLDLFV